MNPWEQEPERKTYVPPSNNLVDGFALPALQALFTGLFAALAGGILAAVLHVPASPWVVGFCIFNLAVLASWLSYRGRWAWRLERLLGLDLNLDGMIGDPRPQGPANPVRVELVRENGEDWIDLPYAERLPEFAASVLGGRVYSQTAYVGTGKLFRRGEYDALVAAMIQAGLMRWKNPDHHNQGTEWTGAGRAVLKRLAARRSPALPGGEDA